MSGGFADFMAKQKKESAGRWQCDICCVWNDKDASKCSACESPNPNAPKPPVPAAPEPPKFSFGAKAETEVPAAPVVPPVTNGFGDFMAKQKKASAGTWTCDICCVVNDITKYPFKCSACESPNPNPPKDVKPEEQKEAPKFSFGAPSTPAASGFSFGASKTDEKETTPAAAPIFGASAEKTEEKSAPTFTFGASSESKPAATSSFTFGASKTEEKTDPPTFSFGGSKPAEKSEEKPAEAPKPSFSFGSTGGATSGFSFGAAKPEAATEKPAAPTFSFGGDKGKSAESSAATASFSFETKKPDEPKPFSFGSGTTEAVKPVSSGFGSTEPAKPSFSFSGAGTAASEPAKPFTFGGSEPPKPTETPAVPTFSFGGSGNTASSTNQGSIFGNSESKKPAFSFSAGGNSASTSNSANSGSSLFGSNSTNTGFQFGKAAEPASTGSSSGFNFGSSTPSNGSNENKPSGGFNFGGTGSSKPDASSSMFSPTSDSTFNKAPAQSSSFNFSNNQQQNSSNKVKFSKHVVLEMKQNFVRLFLFKNFSLFNLVLLLIRQLTRAQVFLEVQTTLVGSVLRILEARCLGQMLQPLLSLPHPFSEIANLRRTFYY